MRPTWIEELEAIRQRLSQQNEQWAQSKELLSPSGRWISIPSEFFRELDRVCDVTVPLTRAPSHFQHGAIRV